MKGKSLAIFGMAGPSAKLCFLVLSAPSWGVIKSPNLFHLTQAEGPPQVPWGYSGGEIRLLSRNPSMSLLALWTCLPSAFADDCKGDCKVLFGRSLASPAWRQMAFAGSLSTFAIIKESQIHTIGMKGFSGKWGQKDKLIFPRISKVGRDSAVKSAHASEDLGSLRCHMHSLHLTAWICT